MALRRLVFPPRYRDFPRKRWVKTALRTLHLIGIAGMGGGFLYEAPPAQWMPYFYLTMLSGLLFFALELWSNGIILLQVRGLVLAMKLLLLWLAVSNPDWRAALFMAIVVLAGAISHAPGDVRYYSIFHGRRIGPDEPNSGG